jgi:hypothetical protein
MLASRGLYWRGFALWRRAIIGFNESPSPNDLEEDLNGAITDFNDSLSSARRRQGRRLAKPSCFGYLAYLSMKHPAGMQDMIQHSSSFLKDAMASDPDNPGLLWVLGPIRWSSPPERGGGQDKAFDLYQRGLEAVRTCATFYCRKFKMRRPRRADCPADAEGFDFDCDFDLRGISANRSPALE